MAARVRIRRVRFKAGGEVEMLRPAVDPTRAAVEHMTRAALDSVGVPIGGFAFVVWDNEGGSVSAQRRFQGCGIVREMIPDFVRNRLLLGTAVQWATEDFNEAMGLEPPEDAS